jgi:hypothetical protein
MGLRVWDTMKLRVGYEFYISPMGVHWGSKNLGTYLSIQQGAIYLSMPQHSNQAVL